MEALRERLAALVCCDVDLVDETAVSPRLREAIQQDGVRAF
jgi:predicted nucleotidyltransferase